MRVFSVEMLVKEEGAAVVEAALKRLKGEAAAVAAEMKVTTGAVTTTGKAMQAAATGTQIAGDRAAKAAIGFAAVGQSMARTGSLTADAGTRIVEAGSQIAMMFGPKGLAVAAILSFVAFAASKFNEAGNEAQKMREKFEEELKNIANAGDLTGAKDRLRDIMYGVGEGAIDATVDIKDGMIAIQREIRRIEALPFGEFTAQRGELRRLRGELAAAAQQYSDLQDLIFNPRVAARPTTAPSAITVTAQAPRSAADVARVVADQQRALEEANRAGERLLASGFMDSLERTGFESGRASAIIDRMVNEYTAEVAKKAPDAAAKIAEAAKPIGEKLNVELATSIGSAVEGGVISGLEMAFASGNIGAGFKAMGQAIVQAMASAMVKVALAAIGFGKLLASIQKFMMANPLLAVASAVAMLALARSMGGGASGADMVATGGPGGLSYAPVGASAPSQQIIFGATSATTAAGMTPRSATNVTIIGPNDPSAQRAMQELLAKANSRGKVG
jgi:hypothetical protein